MSNAPDQPIDKMVDLSEGTPVDLEQLQPVGVGSTPGRIASDVVDLCRDAAFWVVDGTISDEDAARFHHRLVVIQAFPNGNGRHARLAVEALQRQLGSIPFSWGTGIITAVGDTRTAYVAALRTADRSAMLNELVAFARS